MLFISFSSYIPVRMWSNDSLHFFHQLVMIDLQKKGNKRMRSKALKDVLAVQYYLQVTEIKKPQVS